MATSRLKKAKILPDVVCVFKRAPQPGSQAELAAGPERQADAHAEAGCGEKPGRRQRERVGCRPCQPEQAHGQQVAAAAQGAEREQGQQGARDVGEGVGGRHHRQTGAGRPGHRPGAEGLTATA